jgi:hypothetical protein
LNHRAAQAPSKVFGGVQFQSLRIGDETIHEPLLGIIATPVTTGDILLGQRFLFSRRFFISNATRTLFLEKPAAPVFSYAPSHVLRQPRAKTGNNSEEKVSPGGPPVLSEPPAVIGDGAKENSSRNAEPAAPPALSYTPSPVIRQAGAKDGNNSGDKSMPIEPSDGVDGSGREDGAQNGEPPAPPAFSYTPSIVVRRPAGGNAP